MFGLSSFFKLPLTFFTLYDSPEIFRLFLLLLTSLLFDVLLVGYQILSVSTFYKDFAFPSLAAIESRNTFDSHTQIYISKPSSDQHHTLFLRSIRYLSDFSIFIRFLDTNFGFSIFILHFSVFSVVLVYTKQLQKFTELYVGLLV